MLLTAHASHDVESVVTIAEILVILLGTSQPEDTNVMSFGVRCPLKPLPGL